jgi:hypothetical protein
MPTTVTLSPNRSRDKATHRPRRRSPLRLVGYALALALFLARLVFGPPTIVAGGADVRSVATSAATD